MKLRIALFFSLLSSAFAVEISGDYLLWIIKKNPVPIPLVTNASYSDPLPGAIGQPGTRVEMGKTDVNMGFFDGFQTSISSSIQTDYGIEAIYFLLPKREKTKCLSTSGKVGNPNYAVPIFDVTGFWGLNGNPGESIYLLTGANLAVNPGIEAFFQMELKTVLQGAQLNGLRKYKYFNTLFGFRWVSLKETFRFTVESNPIKKYKGPAAIFNSKDQFKTYNNFLGAQLGIEGTYTITRWHFDGALKGGLGAMLERINNSGTSQVFTGNSFYLVPPFVDLPGGIFAQSSNCMINTHMRLAGIVETTLRVGCDVTSFLEVSAGYDFLWIDKVLRPGDQVDRQINPTRTGLGEATRVITGTTDSPSTFNAPGGAQPAQGPHRPHRKFKQSYFWAQGLVLGLALRF